MTTTSASGTSLRRRVVTTAAVGATAVALAIALGSHLLPVASAPKSAAGLSHTELAGWSGNPKALTTTSRAGAAASAWCEDGLSADSTAPAAVSNVDQRGTVASMLVSRGGYTSFCVTDGSTGMWEIVDEPGSTPARVRADTVDLQSADQHGTPAIDSAWGSAGSDVRTVVLRADGRTVAATVDHGVWTAWWPGAAAPSRLQAVVTTAAGVTSTIPLGSR